jgi:hypothetical protein
MEKQIDELELMNAALGEGMRIGAERPWRVFDKDNASTWPEPGVYVVGIWKYFANSEGAEVFTIDIDEDTGHVAMYGSAGTMQHKNAPTYWCPLPDPMDYE